MRKPRVTGKNKLNSGLYNKQRIINNYFQKFNNIFFYLCDLRDEDLYGRSVATRGKAG